MKKSPNKQDYGIKGKFRVNKFKKGKLVFQSDWSNNIVVSSNGYGRNIVARHMVGDDSLDIVLDGMVLSTDNTAPTNADTSLGGTEVSVGLELLSLTTSGQANVITFSGFFTDGDLPNGTYYKLGVTMGGRTFTSALLETAETKDTGEEYRIDYQITIN